MKIWNTNVDSVYLRMVNGLLQPAELQAVCRCVFDCYGSSLCRFKIL